MMLVAIKEDIQHNGAKGCEHNAAMQQRFEVVNKNWPPR